MKKAPKKNSCCSSCGSAFADGSSWPRTCADCGDTFWQNPTPVGCAIQPITKHGDPHGIVAIRRAIPPKVGGIAFPAGWMETRDGSWQNSIVREFDEETGIAAWSEDVRLHDIASTPRNEALLVFGEVPPIEMADLPPFTPNPEVSERLILTDPGQKMIFPIHDDVFRRYLTRFLRGK